MANTLTISDFAENIYRAKDTVARELVGFIPSVLVNSNDVPVSINGNINSFVTSQPTVNSSITPAMTIPAADDVTITQTTMTIGQTANVRYPMVGEVWAKLNNTIGSQNALDALLAQAIRAIVNSIESYIGTLAYKYSSRAVGTAGTTPFASSHALIPQLHQILKDNGCPNDGQKSLVINSSAGTNLRNLANIYKVNENGSSDTLRRGVLLDIDGLAIRESAGVASHVKGAGTGYLINNVSTEAIGQTTLTLDGGTVNTTGFKAGDIITHASDSLNKYVVKTGLTATTGDIVINAPGLRIAAANDDALTIGNSYTANLGFHRNAIELAMRPPLDPPGGDAALDKMVIQDAVSGLVFEVAIYRGYKMNMLDITTYYDAKVWKPEFVATLIG